MPELTVGISLGDLTDVELVGLCKRSSPYIFSMKNLEEVFSSGRVVLLGKRMISIYLCDVLHKYLLRMQL